MKKLIYGILLALSGLCNSVNAANTTVQPNIVFILVDDIRYDAFSCMGHPVAKTPNIDRIANEGALFKNFFVTIPLCSPSRGCFLTGQYAHRHGVVDNKDHNELSHKLVTFPKLLRDVGYETAYIGKLHMGNDDSPRPGFDRWVSFKGQGIYKDCPLNIDGEHKKVPGYITDILNSNAVEFINRPHSKPFALYLAHKAVHGPFTPPERYKKLYAGVTIPFAPSINDDDHDKPVLLMADPKHPNQKTPKGPNWEGPQEGARNQLRCLAAIDDGVRDILQALEQNHQLDNTIVVFTSDNGFFWGEHGLGDKRWAYEESIRDPLFIRYPKLIKAGTKYDQMVLNIDIAPTFLELGGAKVPADIQGESMLPLFKSKSAPWRKSALFEYFVDGGFLRFPAWKAARNEDWIYIRYEGVKGMDELFDLKKDRFQMHNLINDSKSANQLKKMQGELDALLKKY
jgi:N-acetylglucosamine-6-sulfatase